MPETQSRRPLTCCDSECAAVNNCGRVGGMRCKICGDYFCPALGGDRQESICEDCLAR